MGQNFCVLSYNGAGMSLYNTMRQLAYIFQLLHLWNFFYPQLEILFLGTRTIIPRFTLCSASKARMGTSIDTQ